MFCGPLKARPHKTPGPLPSRCSVGRKRSGHAVPTSPNSFRPHPISQIFAIQSSSDWNDPNDLKMQRRRRQPGRPALPSAQKRTYRLRISFSSHEFRLLNRRAELVGLPLPILARSILLYQTLPLPPAPRVHYAVVGQLGRIGNLLNQAIRSVNTGRLAPDFRNLIESTLSLLTDYHRDLLRPDR
jgi:hypothetical protein